MTASRTGFSWTLLTFLSTLAVPMFAQVSTATLPTGMQPFGIAVNQVTNKIYVTNLTCNSNPPPCPSAGTVTVIDGATNATATVNVGVFPWAVVVNSVTNKIYVANNCGSDVNCANGGTVTVIDGATNNTASINVGYLPYALAVDTTTNKIYVANSCGGDPNCGSPGTVTIIDGSNNQTSTVGTGWLPVSIVVNASTNKIYVANECGNDGNCASVGTVTVVDGVTNNTATVQAGYTTLFVDLNLTTNKIYAVNKCGADVSCGSAGTVTVIDGATNNTATVNVGFSPYNLAADSANNKIYVPNSCGNGPTCLSIGTVTIIDGSNNGTRNITTAYSPWNVAVNATTNKVYVPNYCGTDPSCSSAGNVSAIDGADNSVVPIAVGDGAENPAVNATTNSIYVTNILDNTVSVIGGATTLQLVNVTPCRVVDTRNPNGTFGGPPITGGTFRSFPIPQGPCGIPANAAAYSLNVTVVPPGRLGFLTIWPTGEARPTVSLMNSLDGRIKANAAIVPAGTTGAVGVYVNNTTNVLIDIDGYFAPSGAQTLEFYPLTPCRVVDTRNPDGNLAGPFLIANQERDFPVLDSSCIPAGANPQAYSFNVTVVPHPTGQRLGFLTIWPTGENRPTVSTLNNQTGTIVANAAIVPVGTGGEVAVYPNNNTDLLIDINGYFAAPGTGGLSLYPLAPCRVLDTRGSGGNGPPFMGEMTVNVETSPCAPPSTSQAYVLNATVVPPVRLGVLTLWPNGEDQPVVSTLNAIDGAITSNMAIVPTANGSIDAYANDLTQLILDISSYFAP